MIVKHKPVLFIDFDRTLFDVDQFYEWLGDERFSRLLDLSLGKIEPPDFAAMVYADSAPFLKQVKKTYRLVLLTFAMNTTLQRRKVRGSQLVPYFDDVIMTQRAKGDEAKEYLKRMGDTGWEHAFIDDAPENIDNMKMVNPEVRCIRIDRTPPTPNQVLANVRPPDFVVSSLGGALLIL